MEKAFICEESANILLFCATAKSHRHLKIERVPLYKLHFDAMLACDTFALELHKTHGCQTEANESTFWLDFMQNLP